jgi:hypothetical protein
LESIKGMLSRNLWRRLFLVLCGLLLFTLLVKGAEVSRDAYTLWKHGMRLKGLAQDPAQVLERGEPERIRADLVAIEAALRNLRAELQADLRPAWLPWPSARQNLAALDELLGIGADVALAGQLGGTGLQAIVQAMTNRQSPAGTEETPGLSEALFTGLVGAQPYFGQSALLLEETEKRVMPLRQTSLWSPLPRLVSTLDRYLRLGVDGLEAAAAAPKLLGDDRPATYLIMAQNNDEIRATGGFITGIGLATLEAGKITQLVIKDSYDFDKFTVDHPYAPEPMQRYMNIILWVTRDGNWWPDFPTSAQAVEDLYHLENSGQIDGVFAFDMLALEALVKAVGPLYLEETQDEITGENVLQKIREFWNPPIPEGKTLHEWFAELGWSTIKQQWWYGRKDFMGLLAKMILGKLQSGGQPEQLGGLFWTLKQAVDEKNIQLYFHDPALQGLLATAGMDGTVETEVPGDYLLALDTNMGYNKVNLYVEKLVSYEVNLSQDAAPQATLTLTYHNRSPAEESCEHEARIEATYEQMAQGCYWNYLRIYVPMGSELLSAEGVTETETLANEYGKTVFTSFLVVPAAESRTVSFTYRLPVLPHGEYKLLVQKQAGTEAVPLKVRIVLPAGVRVLSTQPKPQKSQKGEIDYDLRLREDRAFVLKLR